MLFLVAAGTLIWVVARPWRCRHRPITFTVGSRTVRRCTRCDTDLS